VKTAVKPRNRPSRERRKESRPSELLAAALELFVERGFSATRLEDVAARAGVSKGTLYLYFTGKEDLFKAVVRGGILPAIAKAEVLVGEFAGGAGELLRAVVSGMWSNVGSTLLSGIPKLIIAESGNFPDLARFYYKEVILRGLALMGAILERGIRQGEFRRLDVAPTARAMMGPLVLMMLWRHSFQGHESDPLSAERYLDSYLALILEGLRAPVLASAQEPG
jgi:AcrR family transcriptional regulator